MERVYQEYGFTPSSKVKAEQPSQSSFNENLNNAVGKIIEKQHEVGKLLERLREECDLLYDRIDAERDMRASWFDDSEEKITSLKTELVDMQQKASDDKEEFKTHLGSLLAAQSDLQEQHRLHEENQEKVKKIVETLKDNCVTLSNGVKTCHDNLGNFSEFVQRKFKEQFNDDKIWDEKIKN